MTSKYFRNRISPLKYGCISFINPEETSWTNWSPLSRNFSAINKSVGTYSVSLSSLSDLPKCSEVGRNPAPHESRAFSLHTLSLSPSPIRRDISASLINYYFSGTHWVLGTSEKKWIVSGVNNQPTNSQIILMFFKHIIIKKLHAGRKIISI